MQPRNPLIEKHLDMTWERMSEKTGFHTNTIKNLSKMNKEQLLNVSIGTLQTLKEKLGVDMLKYIKNYK
jgi:hypothetical protein